MYGLRLSCDIAKFQTASTNLDATDSCLGEQRPCKAPTMVPQRAWDVLVRNFLKTHYADSKGDLGCRANH